MKRYIIFIFIFIFSVVSCNQDFSSKQNKKKNSKGVISKDFHGEWTIMQINLLTCNACPVVHFGEKGRGRIIKSSDEKTEFNWNIVEESMIRIQPLGDNIKSSDFLIEFDDYNLKFEKYPEYLQLTFDGVIQKNKYVLRKAIHLVGTNMSN